MLRTINEVAKYAPTGEESLFRIKKGLFFATQLDSKKARKASRYFAHLSSQGLLGEFHPTDTALLQQFSQLSSNCFLGFGPTTKETTGFLNLTSTETSLNRALNRAKLVDGQAVAHTVSGMCLFGSGTDLALTERGQLLSVVSIGTD